jgi:uncharacterized membrane protein
MFVQLLGFSMASAQTPSPSDDLTKQVTDASVDTSQQQFFHGRVRKILEEGTLDLGTVTSPYQVIEVELLDDAAHRTVKIEHGRDYSIRLEQKLKVGQVVVIGNHEDQFYVLDVYRLPALIIWSLLLFGLIVLFGRMRGAKAILGLIVSILVLVKFIVPQIISGASPALVSLLGALVITTVALVLAHGRNRRTLIAMIATLVTLALSVGLGWLAVKTSHLFGLGSEDAYSLQFGPLQNLNFQGLLLGSLLIGALGVLDDITTAQAAVVDELKQANPKLGFSELFKRASSVGREHIASLVNTLVLAYAGASLPLFLVFNLQQLQQPLWVTINSEMLAEEIIRTVIGSAALVLAVPITTALAAYAFGELGWRGPRTETDSVGHHH